jgi:hypothetical protein
MECVTRVIKSEVIFFLLDSNFYSNFVFSTRAREYFLTCPAFQNLEGPNGDTEKSGGRSIQVFYHCPKNLKTKKKRNFFNFF